MPLIYLGLGSNVEPRKNINAGLVLLADCFGKLNISTTYESAAVGFEGDPFWNLVVSCQTDSTITATVALLHDIEDHCGRDRSAPRWSSRTLDIDLLLYGETVCETPQKLPRSDILKYAFVLKPLVELGPSLVHPETGRLLREHWQESALQNQHLLPIEL